MPIACKLIISMLHSTRSTRRAHSKRGSIRDRRHVSCSSWNAPPSISVAMSQSKFVSKCSPTFKNVKQNTEDELSSWTPVEWKGQERCAGGWEHPIVPGRCLKFTAERPLIDKATKGKLGSLPGGGKVMERHEVWFIAVVAAAMGFFAGMAWMDSGHTDGPSGDVPNPNCRRAGRGCRFHYRQRNEEI